MFTNLTMAVAIAATTTYGQKTRPDSVHDHEIEVVAELPSPPGNIAITPSGRIIFSQHPFGEPEHSVLELLQDGRTVPFPTEAWSRPPKPGTGVGVNTVIGIESDRRGIVWMLDMGSATEPPKLVAWDTRVDTLHRIISIPRPVQQDNSFMQDLAIDPAHNAIYIADMSRGDLVGESSPALIVVDIETGLSRRVLDGHPILQPEDDAEFIIDGTPLRIGTADGATPHLGLNPITIDTSSEYVYFGAMNGRTLYRIHTKVLLDATLTDEQVAAHVEVAGPKPPSDGITIDGNGNVYITDSNANGIGVLTPDGHYATMYQDERLSWPDGISFGPDGWAYATVNQLHRHAVLNGGQAENEEPYYIVRFRPIGAGVLGR